MKLICLLLISVSFYVSSSAQSKKKFSCPIKDGEIVIEHKEPDNEPPGKLLIMKSTDGNVYSCSSGKILRVDTLKSGILLKVSFENYVFSYSNLESVSYLKGRKIKRGQFIGKIKRDNDLMLMVFKNKISINPYFLFNCKVTQKTVSTQAN